MGNSTPSHSDFILLVYSQTFNLIPLTLNTVILFFGLDVICMCFSFCVSLFKTSYFSTLVIIPNDHMRVYMVGVVQTLLVWNLQKALCTTKQYPEFVPSWKSWNRCRNGSRRPVLRLLTLTCRVLQIQFSVPCHGPSITTEVRTEFTIDGSGKVPLLPLSSRVYLPIHRRLYTQIPSISRSPVSRRLKTFL